MKQYFYLLFMFDSLTSASSHLLGMFHINMSRIVHPSHTLQHVSVTYWDLYALEDPPE